MKPVSIEVPIELLRRGVLVFFGSRDDLLEYLSANHPVYYEDLKDDDVWPRGSAYTIKMSDDAIIFADTLIDEGTLVHELGHTSKHLLDIVGIKDEEAYCYTIEYLYNKIMPWYRKLTKKKKPVEPHNHGL